MRIKEFPALLVFNSKYGESYYLLQKQEDLYPPFVAHLTDAFESRRFNYLKKDTKPVKPQYTKEDLEKIPEFLAAEKIKLNEAINNYERQLKQYEDDLNIYNKIKEAVESKDPMLCYKMYTIVVENDEYIEYSIQQFSKPK